MMTRNEAKTIAKIIAEWESRDELLEGLMKQYPQFDWRGLITGKGDGNESESFELQEREIAFRG